MRSRWRRPERLSAEPVGDAADGVAVADIGLEGEGAAAPRRTAPLLRAGLLAIARRKDGSGCVLCT